MSRGLGMGKVVTTTALLMLLPSLSLAAAGSVSEMLAERGHPHTTMCNVQESKLGLGQLPFIQFEKNESNAADLQEAVSILKLLAEAFVSIDARYVGFEATRNWQSCQSRDPEFLFWRDQDDNWRYMKEKPLRYLTRLEKDLLEEERGGANHPFISTSQNSPPCNSTRGYPSLIRRRSHAFSD